jgi:precorrin-2 dehydrogenase / sirohydrochlorin ferrochelatase
VKFFPEQGFMSYLPLNIDMQDRVVLIVGGGRVATRKALALLKAGAEVRIVSPVLSEELTACEAAGEIKVRTREFAPPDMEGAFMVITATANAQANAAAAAEARRRGILVAVTDDPEAGNCMFPAVLRRGELEIAVSSSGRCPAFSAQVRDVIGNVISEEYGAALVQLSEEREKLLTEGNDSTYNAVILRTSAKKVVAELSGSKESP